ncbi:MAG TPA: GNAT family N-acetyltransferase [Alphaproteobacteria bacterium]|nr:GNAT family N-acetyltransferase [Alphaproteobacteria bacterium]
MLPDAFRTARLTLRPIALEDAAPIFDGYAQDGEVTRFLSWRPHKSREETVAYVTGRMAAPAERLRTYVLLGREDGKVRGAFDLRRPVPHALGCDYVLARAWWGQGLMTEALAEIARWALGQGTIWRIGAVCVVENRASARVMEKAGLSREGILRRWAVCPNISAEPRDCLSYARVR